MSALAGVRVVDLTHVMAGPTCTMFLADLGADVIKVERIPGGDDSRKPSPYTIGAEQAPFLIMNRNKRGIALDLKRAEGKAALARLIETADVLVENYRHDTLARLGFGWETLKQRHPRLIYCAISGFGRTGPYAERGGFDLVAQAMSGIMSITGTRPGEPPVKCGAPLTDITAGLLAAIGILAALQHRTRTGRGQFVDTSLLEAGIIHTYWHSAITFATGAPPGPMGSAHPLSAPYQALEAADGWLVVGGATEPNWRRLCEALDAPALANDPRFATNQDRLTHLDALVAALTPILKTRPVAEWLARFEAAGVPAGPVYDIAQMHADPQVRARDMVVDLPHAALGRHAALGLPIKLSDADAGPKRGAPLYGEHTRAVLRELGYGEAEIDALVQSGAAIATEPVPV
jgi:crotonobetainyl-CoA:carnitine CoA-transferase CaiB-like acyl-CoA transferase